MSTKSRQFLCKNIHWAFHRRITPPLQNYFPSIISSDPHSSPVRDEGQDDYPHLGDEQIEAVTTKATSSVWWSWTWNPGLGSPDHWVFWHTQESACEPPEFRCGMRNPFLASNGKHWDQGFGNWPWVVGRKGILHPSMSRPHPLPPNPGQTTINKSAYHFHIYSRGRWALLFCSIHK